MMLGRRGAVVWAWAATFGIACACESSVDRSLEGLQCGTEQRCAVGYECRAGICVRPTARANAPVTSEQPASTAASETSGDVAETDTDTLITLHSGAPTGASTADASDLSQALTLGGNGAQASGSHELSSAPNTDAETTESTTSVPSHELWHEPSGDEDNTCGVACFADRMCDGGVCASGCREGQISCAGRCVDTSSDPEHCGRCNQACVGPVNSTTRCEAARCEIVCYIGFEVCQGSCIDVKTDPLNCGGCGLTCKGNRACVGGQCTK